MVNISVLGYCWKDHLQAGYFKFHNPILELVGFDTTVTHLALSVDDWVVHPFSDNKIKWIKRKVSDRCFNKPCDEIYVGHTHKNLNEIIAESERHVTLTWTCYAWFYTCGLYSGKKDCCSWVKNMLEFTHHLPKLKGQTPNCVLKELENNGYRSP